MSRPDRHGSAAAGGVVPFNARKPPAEPPVPGLEHLARFQVHLDHPPWDLGRPTELGNRRIVPITGGAFNGPRLTGQILDQGADWQVVTDAGTTVVDTRYLLRTDDDALIFLSTRGFRDGPRQVLAALAAGDTVDPATYYFRITLTFETGDERYRWLNTVVAIGSALRTPTTVVYDAYLVT
jgi:hypothetical protein